jgi:hypothetical protein
MRISTTAVVLAGLLLSACEDGVVSPGRVAELQLAVVSGDEQTGEAGAALILPLTVQVTNGLGWPVRGVTVNWRLDDHTGALASGHLPSVTDAQGTASVGRILGGTAGRETTTAWLDGHNAAKVSFVSWAQVQGAHEIRLLPEGHGDNQVDSVGATLAPFRALLVNHRGEPVPGVVVHWLTRRGSLSSESAVSGADGIAQVTLTLDTVAGTGWGATAGVMGLRGSPIVFNATAMPGTPVRVVASSGDGEWITSNEYADYEAGVTDQWGNYVEGVLVNWEVVEGAGSLEIARAATTRLHSSSQPVAVARFAPAPGQERAVLRATASGLPARPDATFTSKVAAAAVRVALSDSFDYACFYWGWCTPTFSPREVEIQAGGTVVWRWAAGAVCDVVFEDMPVPPASSTMKGTGTHARTFTEPGVYRYRCTTNSSSFTEGVTGLVIVQ